MKLSMNEFLAREYSCLSLSYGDLSIIYKYCDNKNFVVELGTCMGNTAKMLAHIAKKVMTIDVFENFNEIEFQREMYTSQFIGRPHYFNDIKRMLSSNNNVQVLQGLTHKLSNFCSDNSIDTLFVDADHSYNGVKLDYESWFSKVKVGGHFLFHDCNPCDNGITEVYKYYQDTLLKDERIHEIIDPDFKRGDWMTIAIFKKIKD